MSTSRIEPTGQARTLRDKCVLLVGLGGLGCPAALALVGAGVGRLLLADDDAIEEHNLHRQLLYDETDVGADKLEVASRTLARLGSMTELENTRCRLLPENALDLVRRADVVVEGADNFATKFLAADACRIAGLPIVHGSAIRWRATVWAVAPEGRPCYRCLFEDLPDDDAQPNCAEAGVMGPVVGLAGALMADLALRVLCDEAPYAQLFAYEGKSDALRRVDVAARRDCPLCGSTPSIIRVDEARYMRGICAA